MTIKKYFLITLILLFSFVYSQGTERFISSDEMSVLISLGKEKLRENILRNKEISEGKKIGVKNFIISLSPSTEDLVKDKVIGNYGNFLSSSTQETNLNARLNKVYSQGNLECYIILINAFDAKIKAEIPTNFGVKDLFGNSTFIQEQSNVTALQTQQTEIARRIAGECAAYLQQRSAIVITTGTYNVEYTAARYGQYHLYNIQKLKAGSTTGTFIEDVYSYLKSSVTNDTRFASTSSNDSIASMQVTFVESAVKNVFINSQILLATTASQIGDLLKNFKPSDYFTLTTQQRLHVLNIISQTSMSGYWFSNASDEEGIAIRILKYVPPEFKESLIKDLEADKQNTGTGKIVYRLISKTHDGILEKNYTKLSLAINDLLMKSNLAESKMQEVTQDNICERIYFYTKQTIAEPAIGSMKYEFTLGSDATIKVKSKRVVSYTDHIMVVAGGDPIIQTTAVYQDVPAYTLNAFDLVCISNDNGLSFLEGDAAVNERVIVPAIYLTYIAEKQFNETVIKDVAIAADVLTLVTGVGAISAGIKVGRLAFTLFEMSNALANIGLNVAGDDLSSEYKQVLDYSNGLMVVLGGSKMLTGGITSAKIGFEQARNTTKISKQQLEEFAQKTSKFISEYSTSATLASKKGAKYLYRQYTFIEKECKKVLGKTLAQVRSGVGGVLRKIDDFIPSSGTQLIGNTNKTTTLLGRWLPDMQIIKGKMLQNEFNVGTAFGNVTNNNGGFNFLNIADNLANAAGIEFFNQYNKPWIQQAIHRGDDIVLATRPTIKANFIDPTTSKLIGSYAEELKFLVQQNYKPINLSTTEWNTIKTWFQ